MMAAVVCFFKKLCILHCGKKNPWKSEESKEDVVVFDRKGQKTLISKP